MARFEGEVRTQWLRHRGPDRRMKLLEDFAFVDDNGVRWEAPAGSVVDGASIPEFLWSTGRLALRGRLSPRVRPPRRGLRGQNAA